MMWATRTASLPIFLALLQSTTAWWDCPEGYSVCDATAQPVDFSELPGSLSDCTYVGCPSVIVNGSFHLIITNVTFINGTNSSLQLFQGASADLVNVSFIGGLAVKGGAIFLNNANLSGTNIMFTSNTASWGGDVFLTSSAMTCEGCIATASNATADGGSLYMQAQSEVDWIDGSVSNTSAGGKGGFAIVQNSIFRAVGGSFNGSSSFSDGGCFYSSRGFLEFNSSVFNSCQSGNSGGTAYVDGTLIMSDFNISWSQSNWQGGAIYSRSNATVTLTEGSIVNSSAVHGGGMYVGGLVVIVGVWFGDNSVSMVSGHGGAIRAIRTKLQITDSFFYNNSGYYAAAVKAESNCTVTMTRVECWQNFASYQGGCLYIDSSVFTDYNSFYHDNFAHYGGGMVLWLQPGVGTLVGTVIANNVASLNAGGLNIVYGPCTVVNVTVHDNSASLGGGVYLYRGATLRAHNLSVMRNMADGYGGGFDIDGSYLFLDASNISFNIAKNGAGFSVFNGAAASLSRVWMEGNNAEQTGGGYLADGKSITNISLSTFFNNYADLGAGVCVIDQSTVNLRHCHFTNNTGNSGGGLRVDASTATVLGGGFYHNYATLGAGVLVSGSTVVLTDVEFSDNTASSGAAILVQSRGTPTLQSCNVSYNNGDLGGGIAVTDGTATLINTTMSFNSGQQGGAVYVSGSASAIIQDCTVIGNMASDTGAGFYLTNFASLTLSPGTLTAFANTADTGELITASSTAQIVNLLTANVTASGSIHVEDVVNAVAMRNAKVFHNLPQAILTGLPSIILVDTHGLGANFSMNLATELPLITVTVTDVFGNSKPLKNTAPVVLLVTEVSHNATISGVTAKALLGEDRKTDISGLRFEATGSDIIQFQGVKGTIFPLPGYQWPAINVLVNVCPLSESLNPLTSQCSPSKLIAPANRFTFGIISIVFIICTLVVVFFLNRFRNRALVKANSPNFLYIICVGAMLGFVALVIQIVPTTATCSAAAVLQNLAFILIFGALILKTFRIHQIFRQEKLVMLALTDARLFRYLGAAVVCMIAYLITWMVLSPPVPVKQFSATYVAVDRCNPRGPFGIIMTVFHVFVVLLNTYLAVSVRDIPVSFNESRNLLFASYNWCVCTLLDIVAQYLIGDPDGSFALAAFAQLLCLSLSVLFLCCIKLYTCIVDPKASNQVSTALKTSGTDLRIGGAQNSTKSRDHSKKKSIFKESVSTASPV